MVRVPTSATYARMISNSMANKALLDTYTYQSMTGIKSLDYAGYGASSSTIVSLEATLGVTMNFMETNKIVQTDVDIMESSIKSIGESINDFESSLLAFSGMNLESIHADPTGGELKLTDVDMTLYEGSTITANGVEYTIGNNPGQIPTGTTPQELMENIGNAVPEIFYNDVAETLSFDLYTLDGYSSILNVPGIETGDPHEPSQDQQQLLREIQNQAFTTLKLLADTLNISASGSYAFGGGVSTEKPVDFPFANLEEFQAYYDGINLTYPTSEASVLSNREITTREAGELTFDYAGGLTNTATITSANPEGFLKDNVSANPQTSGNLTFTADTQSITASVGGAFNTYQSGDLMVIEGTAGNNGVYKVTSVSQDGKTVKVEPMDGTGTITDEAVDVTANPDVVEFKSTFPLDTMVDLNGMDGLGIKEQAVQITGVSADGTQLFIKVDPGTFPTGTYNIPESQNWSMEAVSYYQGGNAITEKYVSESQSVTFDITAQDPAFAKMFIALGQIAQGNLVDTRPLTEDMIGTIDYGRTEQLVTEALDLIQVAMFDPSQNSSINNYDFYSIQSKVNSNLIILNNVEENHTAMKLNLENNISSLKNVNQEEASMKAIFAANQLEASYAAMQNAMNVSLLDYIR